MGVDLHGVRAVRGLRAHAVVARVLRRLLRRPSRRDEGRVARHRARIDPAEFPELVPRQLSVRLREVPDGARVNGTRGGGYGPRSAATDVHGFASDVRRDLALAPKQLQSKYL